MHGTPKAKKTKQLNVAKIRQLRGCLKRKSGEPPFAEQWAAYKREELEMEERKFACLSFQRGFK